MLKSLRIMVPVLTIVCACQGPQADRPEAVHQESAPLATEAPHEHEPHDHEHDGHAGMHAHPEELIPHPVLVDDDEHFVTIKWQDQLWVFKPNSEEVRQAMDGMFPVDPVLSDEPGPDGMPLRAVSQQLLLEYQATIPGYEAHLDEDALWIFRARSQAAAAYQAGNLDRLNESRVIKNGAGPAGTDLKAPDSATLEAYLASLAKRRR